MRRAAQAEVGQHLPGPERHPHVNPGRLTGLRFVKEEQGYHLFSVYMARGQKLDSVEVAFPDIEFEAGGSRAASSIATPRLIPPGPCRPPAGNRLMTGGGPHSVERLGFAEPGPVEAV